MDMREFRMMVKSEGYRRLNRISKQGAIVLAGSSLCEQFPVNEMLMSRGEHMTVYNRGVSGDTIDGYRQKLEECVFALEPEKLFINIGTNDMNGDPFDMDTFIAKYRELLETVCQRLPRTTVYVLAYYPVNPAVGERIGNGEVFHHRTNARVSDANRRVAAMAEEMGLSFIDCNAALVDQNGRLREEFTMDGMHMYADAYRHVLDVLLPYMRQ